MHYQNILDRSFSFKFLGTTLVIMFVTAVLTVLLLYFRLDYDLGQTYEQKLKMLFLYKAEVIRMSVFIYAGASVITLIGMVICIILYTHRVVGPLVRIRAIAKEISSGNFQAEFSLRQNDAIQPVAESLLNFAEVYSERHCLIRENLEGMLDDALKLSDSIREDNSDESSNRVKSLTRRAEKLNKIIAAVRL